MTWRRPGARFVERTKRTKVRGQIRMFKLIRVEERGLARYVALSAVVALAVSCWVAAGKAGAADPGTDWTARTSAADNIWESVSYGNGLFVAVSSNGTDRVMTSPDGATWTGRAAAVNNNWQSVTFGNGLFVAVASSGTGNRVMTSPDGITWTSRTSAADNQWESVTYGGRPWRSRSREPARSRRDDQPGRHHVDVPHVRRRQRLVCRHLRQRHVCGHRRLGNRKQGHVQP